MTLRPSPPGPLSRATTARPPRTGEGGRLRSVLSELFFLLGWWRPLPLGAVGGGTRGGGTGRGRVEEGLLP